jgi:hypothetical protein
VLDDASDARVHAGGKRRVEGAFIAARLVFLVIDAARLDLGDGGIDLGTGLAFALAHRHIDLGALDADNIFEQAACLTFGKLDKGVFLQRIRLGVNDENGLRWTILLQSQCILCRDHGDHAKTVEINVVQAPFGDLPVQTSQVRASTYCPVIDAAWAGTSAVKNAQTDNIMRLMNGYLLRVKFMESG